MIASTKNAFAYNNLFKGLLLRKLVYKMNSTNESIIWNLQFNGGNTMLHEFASFIMSEHAFDKLIFYDVISRYIESFQ